MCWGHTLLLWYSYQQWPPEPTIRQPRTNSSPVRETLYKITDLNPQNVNLQLPVILKSLSKVHSFFELSTFKNLTAQVNTSLVSQTWYDQHWPHVFPISHLYPRNKLVIPHPIRLQVQSFLLPKYFLYPFPSLYYYSYRFRSDSPKCSLSTSPTPRPLYYSY